MAAIRAQQPIRVTGSNHLLDALGSLNRGPLRATFAVPGRCWEGGCPAQSCRPSVSRFRVDRAVPAANTSDSVNYDFHTIGRLYVGGPCRTRQFLAGVSPKEIGLARCGVSRSGMRIASRTEGSPSMRACAAGRAAIGSQPFDKPPGRAVPLVGGRASLRSPPARRHAPHCRACRRKSPLSGPTWVLRPGAKKNLSGSTRDGARHDLRVRPRRRAVDSGTAPWSRVRHRS